MEQEEKKPVPYSPEDTRQAYEVALKHFGDEEVAKMAVSALIKRRGGVVPEEYRVDCITTQTESSKTLK